jgi:hypothetical protein
VNLNFLNSGTGVNLDALSMCDFLTPVPPLECKGTPQTAVDGRFPETTAESLQIQPTHQQRNFNGQVLTKLEQIEQELKNTCHTLATQHTNLNTSTSQSICLYIIHLLPQHPKTSQDISGSNRLDIRGMPLTIAMTGSGAKATPGGGMKALLERIHLAMASWGRGNTR